MKIAFRADASITIGSGHIMRCLTLADALRERSASILFLCRDEPGHLGNLITARGYEVKWLPPVRNLAEDVQTSIKALTSDATLEWLVVDHYDLDDEWESNLRGYTKKIMVIDDLADRQHDCNLLLDQNLQKSQCYTNLVSQTCQTLIGPKYALLRPQFAIERNLLQDRDGKVSRLLVFFGGSDVGGETLKALSAIELLGRPDLNVDVVIGATNPRRELIESACRAIPNAILYCQIEDMATRMVKADLFIGAGGTSSWERCCLGLPALVMATASNQISQCEALNLANAHLFIGVATFITEEKLMQKIAALLKEPYRLKQIGDNGRNLVDGQGVARVLEAMQI